VSSSERPAARLVLIVEDNPDALEMYAMGLRAAGYEVLEASTLSGAEDKAALRRPNIIVLDRNLPDGDGLELAARWRRSRLFDAVPIIMLTASGARADVERSLFAGCDVFLTKPCTPTLLVEHVERALAASEPTRRFAKPSG
jgi:DNA-binding response OmpR family regulator